MDETTKNAIMSIDEKSCVAEISDSVGDFVEKENNFSGEVPLSKVHSVHINKIIETTAILKSNTAITPDMSAVQYMCQGCGYRTRKEFFVCHKCSNNVIEQRGEVGNKITAVFEEEYVDMARTPVSMIGVFFNNTQITINELSLGCKYRLFACVRVRNERNKSIYYLEILKHEPIKEGLDVIHPTDVEIAKFKELSQSEELLKTLRESVFGTDLYNLDLLQESILLMMASAPKRYVTGNVLKNRGNVMVLLASSPGKGKSMLLKRAASFFPKSRYATCSGATAIGLVASVQKDDRVGDYVLSPGAVALCHPHGIACIDELDKIDKADLTKLNTQMDSLVIPIDKANIHRRLQADVSILAAMNPKYGTFDLNDLPYNQLNLKKDFLDRFDLVFNIDYFNTNADSHKIASKSLTAYVDEEKKFTMDQELTKKYFAYARTIQVKLDRGTLMHIKKEFDKLVGSARNDEQIYYSIRLLDNLVRLVCAYSRIRLSSTPDFMDVQNAAEMMLASFKSLGIYSDENGLNQFAVEQVVEPNKKTKIRMVRDQVGALQKDGPVSHEELQACFEYEDFEDIIEFMLRKGEIFEPRRGHYKTM